MEVYWLKNKYKITYLIGHILVVNNYLYFLNFNKFLKGDVMVIFFNIMFGGFSLGNISLIIDKFSNG